jgi:anti-anti-sigma factor
MTPPCQNYHLFLRGRVDGLAVHPVGRLPLDGDWLLDQRLLDLVSQARPGSLYVDCSLVQYAFDAWLSHMLRLFKVVRGQAGRLVLCGVHEPLSDVLAITQLDRVVGVRRQEVPGGALRLLEPSWLAWNDGTVLRLTRGARSRRALDLLPVLADALEEAGCTEADILTHCRCGGPHLPDCWVLGLLAVEA